MAKHGGDGFRGDGFASGGHTPEREHPHTYKKGGSVHDKDTDEMEMEEEADETSGHAAGGKAHPKHHKPHMPHSPHSAHHKHGGHVVHSGHHHMKKGK